MKKMKIVLEADVDEMYSTDDVVWAFYSTFEHSSDLHMLYNVRVDAVEQEDVFASIKEICANMSKDDKKKLEELREKFFRSIGLSPDIFSSKEINHD